MNMLHDSPRSQMLRIVMISPLPPEPAGESAYTAKLITGLTKHSNIQITAMCGIGAKGIGPENEHVKCLPVWQRRDLLYPLKLLRLARLERPHVVHVQFGPDGRVYGGLFGEPMLYLLVLLRTCGIRTTVTLHSTWMHEQVEERFKRYRILRRFSLIAPTLFRLYMRLLDLGTSSLQLSTVRIDSTLRRRFLHEWGYRKEKVLEIPHPCEPPQRRANREEALESMGLVGKSVILVIGFIRREKGLEVALAAMSTLLRAVPDSLLLIAGTPLDKDGARYLMELKEAATRFSVSEHTKFDTRFIPEEEMHSYVSAASVVILPYVESVGASGPAHRLAGYGIPILASDVGHHMRECLGGNLVLFKAGDPKDLAVRLEQVLSDSSLAESIGQRLQQYAATETWEVAVERTLANYQSTLKLD